MKLNADWSNCPQRVENGHRTRPLVSAVAMPLCCEKHEDEFKAEFLRVLSDCIVEEREAAEAEGDDGDAPPQVH